MLAAFREKQVRIPYHRVQLTTSSFPHFLGGKSKMIMRWKDFHPDPAIATLWNIGLDSVLADLK
jgi:hypothetical protein